MKKYILGLIPFLILNCNSLDEAIASVASRESKYKLDHLYKIMLKDQEYKDILYKADNTSIKEDADLTTRFVYGAGYLGYQLGKLGPEKYKKWNEENFK